MSDSVYIAYTFKVSPLQPATEILIAELGVAGFESFVETDTGVIAYINKDDWNEEILSDVQILTSQEFNISYAIEEIEQANWNSEWEKNFDPILVDNTCAVRAPFHEKFDVQYDIIIEPKMSFGTGHHETTHMMIQQLLQYDLNGKTVLDMGCGTGVLAILTELKGASSIDAIDIDNWCYINSIENISRNKCKHISVYEGDAKLILDKHYDVIIANINRNILLNDMEVYVKALNKGGVLFLSGFYQDDIPIIEDVCNANFLKLDKKIERNNWVSLKFIN